MPLAARISLLLIYLSALRPLFKYAPYPAVAMLAYALGLLGLVYLWWAYGRGLQRLTQLLQRRWLTGSLLLLMALAAWVIYPIADARKLQGKGSTADDAMIVAAEGWWEAGHLYDGVLYDGAPISPGPGWVLLHGPLIWLGGYALITVLNLGLLALIWHRVIAAGAMAFNLTLILLSSSLLFWDLLVTGHDLIAFSVTLCSLTLLIHAVAIEQRGHSAWLWGIAVLVGWVATGRVLFICYPLLMGLFLLRLRARRAALIVGVVGTGVALAWHIWGYWAHDFYQPLHLFGRGERKVGLELIWLGLLATLFTVGGITWRLSRDRWRWLMGLGYCLLVPLGTIAVGEWWSVGRDFALWEGANYLLPALLPLLLVAGQRLSEGADQK